jgi:aldehyde dehydrogenase (NAD+)
MREYLLFIDNQFVPARSGETFVSINPFTEEVEARFAKAGSVDVDLAVKAARRAFDEGPWRHTAGQERSELLGQLAEAINRKIKQWIPIDVAETGGTFKKVKAEYWMAVNHLRYFSKLAKTTRFTETLDKDFHKRASQNILIKEPVGVCAQIIPWNFPLQMAIWKIGPALAAGCTVVLKPAEESSSTAMELAQVISEIGFPSGVVNIITGTGEEAGSALAKHPDIDKIAFTGSTEIGRLIMADASDSIKRITLECGGKSANIWLEDADLNIALDGSVFGAFYHAGQCCTAGSRLFIPESKAAEWVPLIIARAQAISLGNPQTADMGPVISQKQQHRINTMIDSGLQEGAEMVLGQDKSLPQKGFFVQPTVFYPVANTMAIAQQEIFGPVLCIIPYKEVEDAIAMANDSIFGLAGAVWSRDAQRALHVAQKLRAGTVWINEYHMISEKVPFGGFKQSGLGRELGPHALDAYLEVKHIHIDALKKRSAKFWYDAVTPTNSGFIRTLWNMRHQIAYLLRNRHG